MKSVWLHFPSAQKLSEGWFRGLWSYVQVVHILLRRMWTRPLPVKKKKSSYALLAKIVGHVTQSRTQLIVVAYYVTEGVPNKMIILFALVKLVLIHPSDLTLIAISSKPFHFPCKRSPCGWGNTILRWLIKYDAIRKGIGGCNDILIPLVVHVRLKSRSSRNHKVHNLTWLVQLCDLLHRRCKSLAVTSGTSAGLGKNDLQRTLW